MRVFYLVATYLLGLGLGVYSFDVQADEFILVKFTRPTEREDGTPLKKDEIAGYQIFIDKVPVNHPSGRQLVPRYFDYTLVKVPLGEHTINLTTVDTDGLESLYSNDLVVTIGSDKPGEPEIICK